MQDVLRYGLIWWIHIAKIKYFAKIFEMHMNFLLLYPCLKQKQNKNEIYNKNIQKIIKDEEKK